MGNSMNRQSEERCSVDRSSVDQIKCGKNTIKKGRKCVSSTKCGPGTKNVNNLCLPISGVTKCGRNTTNVDNICELNSHINACEGNKQLFKQLKNRVNKDIQNIISLLKSPDVLRLMEIFLASDTVMGDFSFEKLQELSKLKEKINLQDTLTYLSKLVLYTSSKNKPEHLDLVMVPYIKDLLESLKLNFNSSEEELLKIKQIKKMFKTNIY